jgi:alpha-1,6-mannosyltransferase
MPEEKSRRKAALFATDVTEAGQSDTAVALPRAPLSPRIALPEAPVAWRRVAARLALATLFGCCAALVIFASSGPTVLVWHSQTAFPDWMAGPLHGLFGRLPHHVKTMWIGFSGVLVVMLIAYGVALRYASKLSMRLIWGFVFATMVILVLGPPLQGTDLFNYLGYARLWALHGLNPYTHVIAAEAHDPVWLPASWHHWRSPYGPLFTALTYPLGLMPVPVAYWVLKVAIVALGLVFVWLVYSCAKLTGRDPRWAVLLVAANPLFLVQEVGGFHNDFFMIVPSMTAILLLMKRRDRWAGAAIAVAVAVKYTAIVILPFMLLAARPASRRWRLLSGLAIAGVPLAVASLALFGTALPNVAGQSKMLTAFSIPNLLGWVLGFGGGAPVLLEALQLCVVGVIIYLLLRNRDWLSGAGWATAALIASLGSLWPWYVVWLLPLAAIASSARLRAVALALTVFVVITSVPYTQKFLGSEGINPMASPVGRAANALVQQYTR